ncbi:MAG: excinuclease ABC subunit UvrA [Bacteroidia bacterium]|nr:excinuclease ABC subunit UvrA [Bacteroidia bacterium]MDW8301723.1 excinuclease ABC subunit UvrA [Bacteroidia bacterium]
MSTSQQNAFEKKDTQNYILIKGARTHNLKNIDLAIPRNKLIVITGLSGSGKSSLAFDTLYAEGQRKYVESLSAYIRQFVDQMEKPDVDYILGISPAIAIQQKVSTNNSRSTVGTITEIYDYLRLLFARVGQTYSPVSDTIVKTHTIQDVVDFTANLPLNTKVYLTVSNHKKDKRTLKENLEVQLQKGFSRLFYYGQIVDIEDFISTITKKEEHDYIKGNIYLLIDRTIIRENFSQYLNDWSDSVSTAFSEGEGELTLWIESPQTLKLPKNEKLDPSKYYITFSDRFEADGIAFERPTPEFFNFNTAYGACALCQGSGYGHTYSRNLIIPAPELSVKEGAVRIWKGKMQEYLNNFLKTAPRYGFDIDKPYESLTEKEKNILWYGLDTLCVGIIPSIMEALKSNQIYVLNSLEKVKTTGVCASCEGTRVRMETNYVKIGNKNIRQVLQMSISEVLEWINNLELSPYQQKIAERLLIEIQSRLEYVQQVGLEYLTLHRNANTLSGGETQRIHLAKSLGSPLINTLYILDEPSIGLHPNDTQKLIQTLKNLRNLGNTVIVVEHDPEIMKHADYIIDMGKYAGENGGNIVFQGKYSELLKCEQSLTGAYLSGRSSIPVPKNRRKPKDFIILKNINVNNLQNVSVDIPTECLTVVTGISGSGKSSLIVDALYQKAYYQLRKSDFEENKESFYEDEEYETTEHLSNLPDETYTNHNSGYVFIPHTIDFVELIDQNPVQRSSRSNVVTYTKTYDFIRSIFAQQPLSKQRNYSEGHFSYNSEHGACDVCEGEGYITIDMQFMADLKLVCDICQGKRFKKDILDVKYKDKNIYEVLQMTVNEAILFFSEHLRIINRLKPLEEVGLGYIRLGQSTDTFSGGELQRLKLAAFLVEDKNRKGLYIFDEPTTGLHLYDIEKLVKALNKLVDQGHTVVVIEHNLEFIKTADYVIELGPGAGDKGGKIVFTGTPEKMIRSKGTVTGSFLKPLLQF